MMMMMIMIMMIMTIRVMIMMMIMIMMIMTMMIMKTIAQKFYEQFNIFNSYVLYQIITYLFAHIFRKVKRI